MNLSLRQWFATSAIALGLASTAAQAQEVSFGIICCCHFSRIYNVYVLCIISSCANQVVDVVWIGSVLLWREGHDVLFKRRGRISDSL